MKDDLNLNAELKRKTIHIICSILPILYYFFLEREQIVLLSGIITILFLIGEFVRYNFKTGASLFEKVFFPLLRKGEKTYQLTGATYLFLSATVTFFIFDKIYAIAAVLILTVADSLAAIVGRSFGKINISYKTLEGSVTFFLTSFIIINIFVPIGCIKAFGVGVILTAIESQVFAINDNIIISISAALLLSLAATI